MDIVSSGANLVGGAINAIAQNKANKQMLSEMRKIVNLTLRKQLFSAMRQTLCDNYKCFV